MIIAIKIVLVGLVLFGMIMALMGISHLFTHGMSQYDDSDSEDFRHEVESDRRVISDSSVFSGFLVRSLARERNQVSRNKN